VSADDAQGILAEMTPRRLWVAGDRPKSGEFNQGLFLIEHDRRAILFEGDYECYMFPAIAVLSCSIETLPDPPATTASLYAVVVQVRLGGGIWDFPFFPLAGIEGKNHWERAVGLLRQIERLCGYQPQILVSPPRSVQP
jgi:hypothetical protein